MAVDINELIKNDQAYGLVAREYSRYGWDISQSITELQQALFRLKSAITQAVARLPEDAGGKELSGALNLCVIFLPIYERISGKRAGLSRVSIGEGGNKPSGPFFRFMMIINDALPAQFRHRPETLADNIRKARAIGVTPAKKI